MRKPSKRLLPWVLASCLVSLAVDADLSSQESGRTVPPQAAPKPTLPIDFVENRGQWATDARFVAQRGPVTAALEPHAIRLQLGQTPTALAMVFEGASTKVTLSGEGKQPGLYNYFIGNDASAWRTGVPAYSSVIYRQVYDGVDVRVREQSGLFEYDLLLSPRTDLSRVVIRADGASRLELLSDGSLVLHTPEGPLRQTPPRTMEVLPSGATRAVASAFRIIDAHRYSFEVPERNDALPLVIDPGLEWSTFLGGSGSDPVGGVALVPDGTFDVIVAGWPNSLDYPTLPGSGSPGVHNSIAVLRLNSTGTALRYATFFGGWHSQLLYRGAVAVNTAGEVVVGGEAYPPDFPTTSGAFDRVRDGDSSDGFVTRLNAAGVMTASTFLGGVFGDSVATVAFAPDGSIIAGGNTTSSDFPTTAGAFDRTYNVPNAPSDGGAHGDMFVARLSNDLSALTYGTFIGGPQLDVLEDIAVDPLGFVNVTGWVTGNNVQVFVSTPGAFDASWNGSQDVAFARLKLDGAGAADLKYATLMGGSNQDNGVAVAFSPTDPTVVTIAGHSWSDNFPVSPGVIKPTNPRFSDLFEAEAGIVARFQFPASGGGTRLWSTYFGSEGFERASEEIRDVVINTAGEVIIAGKTDRTAFPTTRGAYDRTHAGGSDGFVARINGSGTQLLYSTFFGGADSDDDLFQFTPLLSYVAGNTVLVAGSTGSTDFPVSAGALQDAHGNPEGGADGYVLRLALDADASGDLTVDAPVLLNPANGAVFARNGFVLLTWSEVSDPAGIDSYEYQVSPKPDFPDNFLHYKSSVAGTSARLHESLATIQWYWRVRTADRAGNLSAWSPTSTFTLGASGGKKSVTSVGILPASVVGGNSASGLVYITGPAPAGGVVVHLSVHHSTAYTFAKSRRSPLPITVPATVTVPEGATQVAFTATTDPVTQSAPGAILATVDGVGQFGFLSVEPPGTTGTIRLDFTPMTVAGGKDATGTVTLGAPAPAGGQLVTIASQHPLTARASVTSLTVPAGATTATFPVTTSPVTVAVDASFAVVSNRGTWATSLRVRPSLPRLLSLSFSPSTVPGGQNVTGTLTVSGPMISSKWPAGPDELVRVWSSDPLAADTGSQLAAIAAGATSGTFTAFTRGLPTARTVTFFAALDDVVVSAPLNVQAAPTPALSSVTFQPAAVNGGQGGIGRVNLSAPATATVFVPLSTNSPGAVSISSGVTLFAGDTSSMFTFNTANRSTAANVNVTATFGSASATGTLTINPSASASPIPLASLSVDRLTTPSGTPAIGTATLASAARPGGVTVRLGTSDFNVAEVPFEIVVPGGATSATFTITTKSVTAPSDVIIHGLAHGEGGLGQSAGLTVTPGSAGPTLSSLSLSPTSVTGGTSSTGTVTLSSAAPSGGRVVALSSSNTAAATVPASVTVAAGTTSRTFTVTTQTVTSSTSSTITATLGTTRTATLTVNTAPPPTPAAPSLVSPSSGASVTLPVTLDWNDVTAAVSYQIQVDNQSSFSAPRVIDQTVTTSQFTVTSLAAQQHWWRVRGRNSAGTNGAWSSTRSFTPQSAPATAALSAVSVNPSSVVGGNGSQGTVTLTAAAPSGGFAVSLSSSNTAVATVPANVTVAQGSTTATFAIGTSSVTTSTPVTITANAGTVTRTATLTVTAVPPPAALSAVSVSPASVVGGNGSQGTVTLTAAAPSGGFVVSLSSSNTSVATVPVNVTVAQGATTATFAIGTSVVATSTPVTITAGAGTVTRTATLTVTPPSQTATLTVTATGRSGERVTTSPSGINVAVGSTQSASFTTGTSITLSVTNGRDAIWSGACSTGGNKQRTCTFTFNANGTVTANVQ